MEFFTKSGLEGGGEEWKEHGNSTTVHGAGSLWSLFQDTAENCVWWSAITGHEFRNDRQECSGCCYRSKNSFDGVFELF